MFHIYLIAYRYNIKILTKKLQKTQIYYVVSVLYSLTCIPNYTFRIIHFTVILNTRMNWVKFKEEHIICGTSRCPLSERFFNILNTEQVMSALPFTITEFKFDNSMAFDLILKMTEWNEFFWTCIFLCSCTVCTSIFYDTV